MKRIKKIIKFISLLLIPCLLSGCFNYSDINKITFSTSVIFDIDDFGNSIVYLDCIKPYRSTNDSSDKGRRLIYKGEGKTAQEALKDINMASSYKLNYTQSRAYIFTEAASKKGIKKYMDLINNDQQFQVKPDLFVYYGDVTDLLKVTTGDEEYLGLYLNDLAKKNVQNPRAITINTNDYLSNVAMGINTNVVTAIEIRKDAIDRKVEMGGGAVIKDGNLVDKIEISDSMSYNILMNNVKGGTLEMANPQSSEGFITLEVLENNTRTKINYDGNKITLIKDIEMRASLGEAQGRLLVDKELLDYIQVNKEEEIKGYLQNTFEKYKKQDLDVFEVARLLQIHYPKAVVENPLMITDLELNVNLILDGSVTVKDSI